MSSQTREGLDKSTKFGFIVIGFMFVAYFTLQIASNWTNWNQLLVMTPMFIALLVCIGLMINVYRKIADHRKIALANQERIRTTILSSTITDFLTVLEKSSFKRLDWEIRKKAVDGDDETQKVIGRAALELQAPWNHWETNSILLGFLTLLNENVGYYTGQRYAQGVLVGVSKDIVNQSDSIRMFMIDMIKVLYPDLKEWKLLDWGLVKLRTQDS